MKKLLLLLLLLMPFQAIAMTAPQMATVFHPVTLERHAVDVGDPHAFDGGYLLEVAQVVNVPDDVLGFSVVTDFSKSLSSSMNSSQATVAVTSMTTKDGHTLTMGDLGNKGFLVIEPGARKEEIVMFTGISGTTFTGITRGLAFYGTSTASVAANRKTHSSGSTVIISNTHYIYDELLDKDSAQVITGTRMYTASSTFTSTVDFPGFLPTSVTTAPTTDGQLANKKYVDDVISSGAPDGTESVKGINELATQIEMASSTLQGTTATNLVLQSQYATSTAPASGLYLPVTENDGNIDQGFLDLTENFSFSDINVASSTFTATTTFSNAPSITEAPTYNNDATRKSYVDTNDKYQLLLSDGQTAFTDSTSNNTYASTTIPGGSLGTNNAVKCTIHFSGWDSAGDVVTTFRLLYDGTIVATVSPDGDTPVPFDGKIEAILIGNGGTGAQTGSIYFTGTANNSNTFANSTVGRVGQGTTTKDSTGDLVFSVTGVAGTTGADITIESVLIELLKQ